MFKFRLIFFSLLILIGGIPTITTGNEVTNSDQTDSSEVQTTSQVAMTTSKGAIIIELNHEKAPISVSNFLQYVDDGYYDGTIFHRVISGFMVQGGGLNPDMSSKKTSQPIAHEGNNGLKNDRGTLAMARTSDPHSATSQFFINVVDNDFLNYRSPTMQGYGYTVFGKVIEGMDVVDAIRAVKTGNSMGQQDVPLEPVFIETVKRIKN